MAKLLIVEDDRKINELMVRTLSMNGHECLPVFTGKEAVLAARSQTIDLVLLDINLPDLDGFRVMEELGDIPAIYVTARNEIHDRVRGLDGGAEDYITKPFHIQELISRVRVVLRRYQREEIVCFGAVKVDLKNCRVFLGDTEAVLTKREFELLKALVYNKNLTLTREQLINTAWGWDYDGEERTVDVHVQRLRKKLHLEAYIKTIYKIGYRLEV